jgi:hypothetical protein
MNRTEQKRRGLDLDVAFRFLANLPFDAAVPNQDNYEEDGWISLSNSKTGRGARIEVRPVGLRWAIVDRNTDHVLGLFGYVQHAVAFAVAYVDGTLPREMKS